mmetsp:Transcript_64230/g.206912  ORF Transcript_64230/g.206912 Transcript_64230/m.206912 type:complete len:244 (+) Transcript_64230:204-935(+)
MVRLEGVVAFPLKRAVGHARQDKEVFGLAPDALAGGLHLHLPTASGCVLLHHLGGPAVQIGTALEVLDLHARTDPQWPSILPGHGRCRWLRGTFSRGHKAGRLVVALVVGPCWAQSDEVVRLAPHNLLAGSLRDPALPPARRLVQQQQLRTPAVEVRAALEADNLYAHTDCQRRGLGRDVLALRGPGCKAAGGSAVACHVELQVILVSGSSRRTAVVEGACSSLQRRPRAVLRILLRFGIGPA